MPNKPPAFQFYPQDYLSSSRVAEMTLEEEGAYIRLLCYCWTTGSIPADPERCAKLAGKGCTVEIATNVQRAFNESPTDPERLLHDRLEKERENQKYRRQMASLAGKKSGESRAKISKKPAKSQESNGRLTDVQRNGNTSSSSSDEDGDTLKKPNRRIFQVPTYDEVEIYIEEHAPGVNPEVFYRFYESKGWMVGKNKMKNWRAAVGTWKANAPKKVDRFPKGKEAERIFLENMNK